jgi:dihydrofolate reductase
MRKIIVLSFISLDGVMQAPGGPEEDTSGGFKYGGWSFPYFDEFAGKIMGEQISGEFDLLLGRKTYDIFAGYWPKADPNNPVTTPFNKAKKYVATHSQITNPWENTIRLEGDAVEAVRKLKSGEGPVLQVHGSGNFVQTLLKNDLIDEFWLKFFPITLGPGKKLFSDGSIPAGWELTKCETSPKGVIFTNYKRSGDVRTGSFE